MQKEIKEFIAMMEDHYEFCDARRAQYTYGATVRKEIMDSHAYQALKALADKPTPKMEVTKRNFPAEWKEFEFCRPADLQNKKPKKQTLWEYIVAIGPVQSHVIAHETRQYAWLFKIISEYLEKRDNGA